MATEAQIDGGRTGGEQPAVTQRAEVVRDVYSVQQFKEAKRAAGGLDLYIVETDVRGSWNDADGHPVFPRGREVIEKVGRKYFHMVLDGDVVPVEPVTGASGRGAVRITFH